MANYTNLKDLFTGIANAIRSKTGATDPIVADDFPSAIEGIQVGGGTDTRFIELVTGSLTELNDESIVAIRSYAFAYARKLTTARLPNLRNAVASNAFYGCTELETVDLPSMRGLVSISAFERCSKLKNVNIPQVITVDGLAFSMCTELERIEFANPTVINSAAFRDCSKLATLIIRNTGTVATTLSNANAFTRTPIESGTGYVYVPAALVGTYKAATNWSTYATQIRAIEDYPEITGG